MDDNTRPFMDDIPTPFKEMTTLYETRTDRSIPSRSDEEVAELAAA
jgi:hypothetical protein